MSNMTLYIDPVARDLTFSDGDIRTIIGDETTAQAVRTTLLAWLGEWQLDTRHGTDYATIFDGQLRDKARIRDIITAAIYQEPQVQRVQTVTVSLSGRELRVSFTALLKSGNTISSEVSTNG